MPELWFYQYGDESAVRTHSMSILLRVWQLLGDVFRHKIEGMPTVSRQSSGRSEDDAAVRHWNVLVTDELGAVALEPMLKGLVEDASRFTVLFYIDARNGSSRVCHSIYEVKEANIGRFALAHLQSNVGLASEMHTPIGMLKVLKAFGVAESDRLNCRVFGGKNFASTVSYALRAVRPGADILTHVEDVTDTEALPRAGEGGTTNLRVRYQGKEHFLEVPSGAPCLGAIVDVVQDVPFSCLKGLCGMCIAKSTEGDFRMLANYALTEKDVEDGYILTCQAVPLERNGLIDFDV